MATEEGEGEERRGESKSRQVHDTIDRRGVAVPNPGSGLDPSPNRGRACTEQGGVRDPAMEKERGIPYGGGCRKPSWAGRRRGPQPSSPAASPARRSPASPASLGGAAPSEPAVPPADAHGGAPFIIKVCPIRAPTAAWSRQNRHNRQGTRHQPHQPAVPSRRCAAPYAHPRPNQLNQINQRPAFDTFRVSRRQQGRNITSKIYLSYSRHNHHFTPRAQHSCADIHEGESSTEAGNTNSPSRFRDTRPRGLCVLLRGAIPFISTPISGPVPMSEVFYLSSPEKYFILEPCWPWVSTQALPGMTRVQSGTCTPSTLNAMPGQAHHQVQQGLTKPPKIQDGFVQARDTGSRRATSLAASLACITLVSSCLTRGHPRAHAPSIVSCRPGLARDGQISEW